MKNYMKKSMKAATINSVREEFATSTTVYNSKPVAAARREARANKNKRRAFYQS